MGVGAGVVAGTGALSVAGIGVILMVFTFFGLLAFFGAGESSVVFMTGAP